MDKKRKELAQILPLDTPLSVHVFPSYYCNFKCNYCLHSLSSEVLKARNFQKQMMSFSTYQKTIDDLKDFPNKLKTIIFAGHGEPLMHKEIAKMVRYAKEANVSERVEIVTNASLLTPKMSEALIDAGLDLIRVSIQGLTDEMYKSVSNTNCTVKKILHNLHYLYSHKKNTFIEVKIVDIALQKNEQKKFFKLFGPVSDSVSIEYLIPFIPEIDHSVFNSNMQKCKHGNETSSSKICSMPFYMLVVEPDGNIVPCCSSVVPCSFGNVLKKSLSKVWKCELRRVFLYNQLDDIRFNKVCSECSVPKFGLQKGDYLDNDKDRLKEIYKEKML